MIVVSAIVFSVAVTVALVITIYLGPPQVGTNSFTYFRSKINRSKLVHQYCQNKRLQSSQANAMFSLGEVGEEE